MRRWGKTATFVGAALLMTAGATASVPTQTNDIVPSLIDLAETSAVNAELSQWDADITLKKLGISIDWDESASSKPHMTASIGGNLLLCTNHAIHMCSFLQSGHPGFAEMFDACTAYHFDDCIEKLRNPAEEIGGQ